MYILPPNKQNPYIYNNKKKKKKTEVQFRVITGGSTSYLQRDYRLIQTPRSHTENKVIPDHRRPRPP